MCKKNIALNSTLQIIQKKVLHAKINISDRHHNNSIVYKIFYTTVSLFFVSE